MSNEQDDLQDTTGAEEGTVETQTNETDGADQQDTSGADQADTSEEETAGDTQDQPDQEEEPVAPVADQQEPAPELPAPLAALRSQLDAYIRDMGPGNNKTEKTAIIYQNNLLSLLRNMLLLEDGLFRKGMQMVLEEFHRHRHGVFGPRHVFRYMDKLKVTPDYLKGMQAVIQLLMATADAGSRELALKQVDLKKVADRIQPPEAAARLLSFYDAG